MKPYVFRVFETKTRLCKSKMLTQRTLTLPVVKSINNAGLKVRFIIADAVERVALKEMMGTSGKYGCDYCPELGYRNKVYELPNKTNKLYPKEVAGDKWLATIYDYK
jgi:hypothetical protein